MAIQPTTSSEKGLQQELIDFVTARAVGDAGAALDADSHILTLSTCTGGYSFQYVSVLKLSSIITQLFYTAYVFYTLYVFSFVHRLTR